MKISIGINLKQGPWGGGNLFGKSLSEFLREQGCRVCFDLRPTDLDLILLFDPRPGSTSASYDDRAVCRYLVRKNPNAVVLHRVNECDERKNTSGINRVLARASSRADHTVFISEYLRELFAHRGDGALHNSVIHNGADTSVFHARGQQPWDGRSKLRVATHHWAGHWMKGFDIYQKFDRLLGQPGYSDRLEFTYIGNTPVDFTFQHAKHIQPLHGHALAQELRTHHLYLTASQNEPAGMHHIEAAMCGLPLLYRLSGALPEYCRGHGIGFDTHNWPERLEHATQQYDTLHDAMRSYSFTAQRMCRAYFKLMKEMVARRRELIAQRQRAALWRGALGGWGNAVRVVARRRLRQHE